MVDSLHSSTLKSQTARLENPMGMASTQPTFADELVSDKTRNNSPSITSNSFNLQEQIFPPA